MKRHLLLSVALSASAPMALAQVDWNPGGITGDWTDTANWEGGALPLVTQDARIGDGGAATINPGETVVFKQLFLGDLLNGPNNPLAGSTGDANGTLTMNGGTLNAQNIRLGTDSTGSGTGGTGTFNFIDGTINLIELENNSQAFEIGRATNATGTFTMGDGTTNPIFNYAPGGRFEVGNVGTATSTFNFLSGQVIGFDNLIIGQANGNGTATMVVGGFATAADFSTTADLNMNQHDSSLTINSNGSVTSRDLQFASNGARTSTVTINSGGTQTVNRDMNERGGISVLNIDGGTMNFINTSAPGTGGREREVENLTVTAGSTINFNIANSTSDSIMPITVTGDDPTTASVTGAVTIGANIAASNNSGTIDTWTGGSATWDTTTPDDTQWDLAAAPENVGAIAVGTTYDVIVHSGGITTDGTTNVTSSNPDFAVDMPDANTFELRAVNAVQVSPVTARFNTGADDVDVNTDLSVTQAIGGDAAAVNIVDVNSFDVAGDLSIGGTASGAVTVGTLGGGSTGGMAVTVADDVVFGDGGPQGGFLTINEGTVAVAGDIIEGTDDPNAPDASVNSAQVVINTGTVGANALTVGGSVTSQRFAVGENDTSVAGITISGASGLSDVTTTGTFVIGAGSNASKDGNPGAVSGATGEVIVGAGGTANALNMRIGENGDSVGTLTIDGGDVSIATTTYVGGSETSDNDNETVGSINLNAGTFTAGANTEVGRDGQGFLNITGGTFTQTDANLVLGQSGGANDAEGTMVVTGGDVIIGVAGGSATPSDLNINNSGGTIDQSGGNVRVERNLNLSAGTGDSSYTLTDGLLEVGQNVEFRAGTSQDTVSISGGVVTVGNNFNANAGTNNLVEIDGSATAQISIGNALNLNNSATVDLTLDAAGITPVEVGGPANLGGALIDVDLALYASNAPVMLFDIDGTQNGVFAGILDGDIVGTNAIGTPFAFETAFGDGNDIGLVPVPEPSAIVLALLATLAAATRRRRH